MCGIGAFLEPDGRRMSTGAMLSALRHRGPDGDGVHGDGPAVLVHTRLAIVDLEGGRQPMVAGDGDTAAVVNGEIYNHLDLRQELEACGHNFRSRCDSEVVLHGYREWGLDVVSRLNGMFAFIVWDRRRGRMIAARDPF